MRYPDPQSPLDDTLDAEAPEARPVEATPAESRPDA